MWDRVRPKQTRATESFAMSTHEYKPADSIDERLKAAKYLRTRAGETPPGVRRDELLRKARQAELAANVEDWLAPPDPEPPK
jgi:hypothetical protein